MKSLTLSAPAKLNLILKVIGKRPDGFHELKTLFERIDLCDRLSFAPNASGRIRIRCGHPQVPTGPRNLIYRVARMLQDRYHLRQGVDVTLAKKIPVAAGLAGGSSNAATALIGLNHVWQLGLSQRQLLSLGRHIGSDVPFFLNDCAWGVGTGRGDRIRPVAIRTKLWHILVVPCVKMYSREVFTSFKMQLTKKNDNVNILIHYLKNNNIFKAGSLLSNDLEQSIVRICPSLQRAKQCMTAFPLKGVAFSGSGPTIFGMAASRAEAEHVQGLLRRRYKRVFVVRTL